MTRTPVKNRIKTMILMGGKTFNVEDSAESIAYMYDEHIFLEDVTIIGWRLSVHWSPGTHGDFQAGHVESLGHLTIQGSRFQDGEIAHLSALMRWMDSVTATGVCGDTTNTISDMLPDPYGIDINEGSSLKLMGNANWTALASGAGTLAASAWAIIYYRERN